MNSSYIKLLFVVEMMIHVYFIVNSCHVVLCCFACCAYSQNAWLRRMRCEFQPNWLINHVILCNEHKMFECINAAVLFTDSRQHALSHTASAADADGDGALGSAVPHPTHLLHQSADHGERDHPESGPNQSRPRHCESSTLKWGEYNSVSTTNTDVFSCDVFMLQYRCTAHLPDLYIDVHVSQHLRDKACLQCQIMVTFKL